MPNNNETTTKFKVDISELKKAMQDAKRQISVANSEFKAASSAMDNWAQSTDGISAKLKQLDSNLKSQKTILGSLEQQYAAVVAEQGEGSAAADRLKIAINNQKATISQTEKQISNYNDELVKVAKAEAEASKSGKSVAEVLEDVGNEAEDAGDGFTTLKGTIATFAGNMLTSFVGAIKEGITSLAGLSAETREYRNEMAKLNTAFTTAGFSSQTATQTYKDLQAVLGDEGQAVEAANHLAKLVDNEKDLATWTNIATGVYATFGASLPIEGLTEAANETAKVGQVTGPLADALNWAGISEDAFNEKLSKCTTEQERQRLIMETLNGVYDEASKKFQETNKSVMDANRANSDFNDTVAQMGAKLEPVTTAVKNGFNSLLQEVLKLVEGVDFEAFTTKINSAFKVLKDDVLPAVKSGFSTLVTTVKALTPVIAGLSAALIALTAIGVAQNISAIGSALTTWITTTKLATAAQWLFNAAQNANPIMLVVTLIASLVVALITFIATNEDARKKIGEVWDKVKTKISDFVDSVKTFFTETIPKVFKSLIDWVKKNWTTILTFLINPFAGLFKYFYENNGKFKEFVDNAIKFIKELPSKVWTWLLNTIAKINDWRTDMITKAKDTAQSFINKVVEFIKELPAKVWTWLLNVVTKITEWHTSMITKAGEIASAFVTKIIEFVKQLPDKVKTWLTNVLTKITEWGTSLAQKGKDAATKLLNSVVDNIKDLPDKIKSIGGNIVTGLWNGINDKFSWLTGKIKSFASSVTDKLKSFFGIHSPSKVMAKEVGKWLPEGIAVGIDKNAKSAINAMSNLAVNTVGAARADVSSGSVGGAVTGGAVNNFYQTINSPKQLNRLDIYRQSKNLLGYAGGGL